MKEGIRWYEGVYNEKLSPEKTFFTKSQLEEYFLDRWEPYCDLSEKAKENFLIYLQGIIIIITYENE